MSEVALEIILNLFHLSSKMEVLLGFIYPCFTKVKEVVTRKKITSTDMELSRRGNLFDRAVGIHKKNISLKESLAIALVNSKKISTSISS